MVDVCLLLEGTYPYVSGGVSSWVYQMLKEFHDLSFAVVYLGPHRSSKRQLHYEIPENVVDIREFYLFDYRVEKEKRRENLKESFKKIERFLVNLKNLDPVDFTEIYDLVGNPKTRSVTLHDLAYSQESWEVVRKLYELEKTETSFIDYFWTWRFIYLPFFSLLRIDLPQAKLYHSASTGYAGVLGTLSKLKFQRPLLLTEHGIYTRERKVEIAKADWIYSESSQEIKVAEQRDIFRDWWINFFAYFSRLTYERADKIITLFEGNRQMQIEEGADPQKISIIPNGINFDEYQNILRVQNKQKLSVGFVGRVVPIKDIKTFILACRMIFDELKNVEFHILGPTDEDEEYYKECVLLAKMESLDKDMRFHGKVDPKNFYGTLDVVVLTSISEAQPLVILEAQACAIPVVATAVGACPEMILGSTPDDRLLGQSGLLTPICNPESVAEAVIRLLKDPQLRKTMGEIGRTRVRTYYQMNDFIASYQQLYHRYMEEMRWEKESYGGDRI